MFLGSEPNVQHKPTHTVPLSHMTHKDFLCFLRSFYSRRDAIYSMKNICCIVPIPTYIIHANCDVF